MKESVASDRPLFPDDGERASDPRLPHHSELLERDNEVRTGMSMIHAPLAGEGGRILVVEGVPGVGKTALLAELRERAATSDVRILSATGGELEGGFPFGVVRQLFDPIARRRKEAFEGPARHAAAALGLLDEDYPAEATSQESLYGLYWLVAELAEERPMLLVVDDAHWADAPTIEFLEYLARRAEDLPLALVIASRAEEHGTDLSPIRRIARLPHAAHMRLSGLTPAAVAYLVREHLGRETDEAFSRACHEATGGNPFLVLELLKELADEEVAPTAEQAPRVAQTSPDAVLRTLSVRLAALPQGAGRLAEAAAILGGSTRLRHASALADLDPAATAEAEEALIGADIIRSMDDTMTFGHPLVREVIYTNLSPGRRALLHARAAAILRRAAVPAEEIVPHLLASDPTGEPWRVATLREAARVALERGAPAATVNALRRVLVESNDSTHDPELLAELGSAELMVLDLAAVEHLQSAVQYSDDPDQRGALARLLARAQMDILGDMPGALPILERALAERDALRRDLTLRLEADFLSVARLLPQSQERADARLRELRDADLPDDLSAAPLLANLALHALETTEHADRVARLAKRALTHAVAFFRDSGWVFSFAANTLTWVDRVDAALAAWNEVLEDARRRGSRQLYAMAMMFRAHLFTRTGDLVEAEADIRDVIALVDDPTNPYAVSYGGAFTADILLDRGDLDEAEELLVDADPDLCVFVHSSRSRLHYARGRFEEASEAALACGEMLRWRGGRESPGVIPWRSEAALAMAALGQRNEAVRLASEELELARKQDVPRAIGMALRALGLIAEPGIDGLEEAVEVLERSGSRIELARALIDLGAAMRRARRRADAREPLRRGMDLAHRCGATVLEKRGREELLATGARPRRQAVAGVESLTPTELRVARLAAEGKSNREIAQGLFVSMGTVATHLTHAYQKLQVQGREDLPAALEP